MPGGILELSGPVFGFGPSGSVVGRPDNHELGGLVNIEAGFGAFAAPLVTAGLAVGPAGGDKNFAGVIIDENAGIGAAVFFLRFSAEFAHVHDGLRRGPGLASIPGSTKADVHVFLEVLAGVIAHVGDGEEVAVFCTGDARDSEGVAVVIAALVDEGGESLRILGKIWSGC